MVTGEELTLAGFAFAVIIGMLAAITFSLRNFFTLERRIAQIEIHIQKIAKRILEKELVINKKLQINKQQHKKPHIR